MHCNNTQYRRVTCNNPKFPLRWDFGMIVSTQATIYKHTITCGMYGDALVTPCHGNNGGPHKFTAGFIGNL